MSICNCVTLLVSVSCPESYLCRVGHFKLELADRYTDLIFKVKFAIIRSLGGRWMIAPPLAGRKVQAASRHPTGYKVRPVMASVPRSRAERPEGTDPELTGFESNRDVVPTLGDSGRE